MPLPDPLYVLTAVSLLLAGMVVYMLVVVVKLRKYVMRLAQDKGKAVTEELVELWKQRRNQLPKGSAKHRAYTKRLVEVGELEESEIGH